jgi:hypothetical protein
MRWGAHTEGNNGRMSMRKILFATLAAATVLVAAAPASSQFYMGAGRGGAGI